ncbi:PZF1 [Candida theae]|uniref:Transcription factor IIIA n=1 Tax=Candida theae TaxID=1198502 RepID=A0AAD5BG33_9ASCO|nr:PZF1 [Candida theae]KAI5960535.1 PZF1 [Candida theae]
MMSEDETLSIASKSSGSSRPKRYHCTFENCDKAYNRPSLLDQHLRSHTGSRPFACTYPNCDKSFLRKSHLDAHLVSHSRDKPFHCSTCGKGVNTVQHLKRHEITHTKSFRCTHQGCDESFYKHQSLRHHILSVHEKTLTCTLCDKTFTRPSKLAQHKLKHHGESPAYQCDHPGCFVNCKTWSALQFHVKQEHPRVKCPVCGKGCVGKRGLKSHMLSHDEAIKVWQCNYCDIGKFNKKAALIDHYNEYHDGNIPEELQAHPETIEENNGVGQNRLEMSSLKQLNTALSPGSENGGDIKSLFNHESKSTTTAEAQQSVTVLKPNGSEYSTKSSEIIDVISNDCSIKIKCPKTKCDRVFAREYDLKRHLKWHEENLKRIEMFLDNLQKEEQMQPSQKKSKLNPKDDESSFEDYSNEDAEFDAALDEELNSPLTIDGVD